jgi:hypothetical protein
MNPEPDPTFTRRQENFAMEAPPETLAFTLMPWTDALTNSLAVVDVDEIRHLRPDVHQVIIPNTSDEFLFWLERLFVVPVTLSSHAFHRNAHRYPHPVVAHLHHRREEPFEGEDPQDYRQEVFAKANSAPTRSIAARRHLRLDARRQWRRWHRRPMVSLSWIAETFEGSWVATEWFDSQGKHYDFGGICRAAT